MATPPPPLLPPGSYEDGGPNLRAALIVYLILGVLAVALRFWSRAVATKRASSDTGPRFWWDDWVALIALPWIISTIALGLYLIDLGVGKPAAAVPPLQQLQVLKVFFAVSFVYDTSITLVKISALLFYARVFGSVHTRFRYALWFVLALAIAWLVGIAFLTLFTCIPVQKSWMPMIPGSCIPISTTWLWSALTSAIVDFMILLLPLPMLWKLQMKASQKFLTTAVFVCGYGVVVIALGRIITIHQAGFNLETDLTGSTTAPLYWLGAEGPISLFCICLPSIFFIIRRAVKDGVRSLFSSRYDSRSKLQEKGSIDTSTDVNMSPPQIPPPANVSPQAYTDPKNHMPLRDEGAYHVEVEAQKQKPATVGVPISQYAPEWSRPPPPK